MLPLKIQGISVVIPNYNGAVLLPQILPPLFNALKFASIPYEVIVSDDCSTDHSTDLIQSQFPEIILIKNEINQGFSPTINKGIFKAKYDLVFLLNNDVKLEMDYFTHQFRYFEREDTFGVMGRIIGWDDDLIQDGAKYPRMQGFKIKTNGNYISLNPQKDDWLYSIYLSGANALVDRKKLLMLDGFDEIFAPFYVEDYELSIRAWRLGWKCYFEYFSVCRHATSITIKKKSSKHFIKKIYNRNKMILHAIHLSPLKRVFWYVQILFELFIHVISGQWFYVESFFLFLRKQDVIRSSRQQLLECSKKTGFLYSLPEVFSSVKKSLKNHPFQKI